MNLCTTILFLFTDSRWLSLTRDLANEWQQVTGLGAECVLIEFNNQSASAWGTREYFSKIEPRLAAVLSLVVALPMDSERGVMLMDSDVFVQRNIDRWIRQRYSKSAHLFIQQEWPCQTAPYRPCPNGGVWWVRRTREGVQLLEETKQIMRALKLPEQDALYIVATRHPHLIEFLPRELYPNGVVIRETEMRNTHIVHVNWLRDLECKIDALKSLRHRRRWDLTDKSCLIKLPVP